MMLGLDDTAWSAIRDMFILAFPIIAGWIKLGQNKAIKKVDEVKQELVSNHGESHHDQVMATLAVINSKVDDMDRRLKKVENASKEG